MRLSNSLRLFTFSALGLLALALTAPAAYRLAAHNLEALSIMKSILTGADVRSLSASAPRQRVWLARHALRNSHPALARRLLQNVDPASDPLARAAYAELAWQQGDSASAVAAWQQIGDYQSLRQAAKQAESQLRREDARLCYQAMLALRPEEAAWLYSDYLFKFERSAPQTEQFLRSALIQYPASRYRKSWYSRLSDLYRQQKRYAEAESLNQAFLAEYPQEITPLVNLGRIYYERDRAVERALAAFQQAIQSKPTDAAGYIAVALLLAREKRYPEAEPWFQDALARDPDNISYLLSWANAVRDSGDLPRAISLYHQALEQSPESASAYYELAWAYRLQDDPAAALQAIQKAIALNPLNEWFFVREGAIYLWQSDPENAALSFKRALQVNPCNEAALRNLEQLNELRKDLPDCGY
ncbi:MAG: tetratricopeptide repeat protein [Anaerolineales bacterium]|nr:tetratricopeptide repeat protein [Anaerolineales bacterium]